MSRRTAFETLPVVDIAPLHDDNDAAKSATAKEIARAASDVGFFYIRGHGVPPALAADLEAEAQAFFALPRQIKERYYIGRSRAHRGYVPFGEEQFYGTDPAKADKKEAFDLAIELPDDDPDHRRGYRFLGPNQWPVELAEFRERVYRYYGAITALGRTLFRGFARALGLPETFFEAFLTKPPSQLRLIHYPATASGPLPIAQSDWGIGAHTDYECFTILHATAPGLEVLNAAGRWIDAPPVAGAFVINIGDMLEALTNGRFLATPHRVRNIPEERYSFPLFCSLDYDTRIEPLPAFVTPGETPAYGTYVAGDHLLAETMRTFSYFRDLQERGLVSIPASEATGAHAFGRKTG
jgi:isopenicillin N synthase-like dioxygenase